MEEENNIWMKGMQEAIQLLRPNEEENPETDTAFETNISDIDSPQPNSVTDISVATSSDKSLDAKPDATSSSADDVNENSSLAPSDDDIPLPHEFAVSDTDGYNTDSQEVDVFTLFEQSFGKFEDQERPMSGVDEDESAEQPMSGIDDEVTKGQEPALSRKRNIRRQRGPLALAQEESSSSELSAQNSPARRPFYKASKRTKPAPKNQAQAASSTQSQSSTLAREQPAAMSTASTSSGRAREQPAAMSTASTSSARAREQPAAGSAASTSSAKAHEQPAAGSAASTFSTRIQVLPPTSSDEDFIEQEPLTIALGGPIPEFGESELMTLNIPVSARVLLKDLPLLLRRIDQDPNEEEMKLGPPDWSTPNNPCEATNQPTTQTSDQAGPSTSASTSGTSDQAGPSTSASTSGTSAQAGPSTSASTSETRPQRRASITFTTIDGSRSGEIAFSPLITSFGRRRFEEEPRVETNEVPGISDQGEPSYTFEFVPRTSVQEGSSSTSTSGDGTNAQAGPSTSASTSGTSAQAGPSSTSTSVPGTRGQPVGSSIRVLRRTEDAALSSSTGANDGESFLSSELARMGIRGNLRVSGIFPSAPFLRGMEHPEDNLLLSMIAAGDMVSPGRVMLIERTSPGTSDTGGFRMGRRMALNYARELAALDAERAQQAPPRRPPSPRTRQELTQIMWNAMKAENGRIALIALNEGADIHYCPTPNWTALHNSIVTDDLNFSEELIKKGAKVNKRSTPEGYTPLHIAAIWDRPNMAVLLLHNGARAAKKDAKGNKPIVHAMKRKHARIVEILNAAYVPDDSEDTDDTDETEDPESTENSEATEDSVGTENNDAADNSEGHEDPTDINIPTGDDTSESL